MTATTAGSEHQGHITGFGTMPYRSFVLTSLTIIYIMNFIDRGLLAVVGPELVADLGISDTAFGLLTGFGFALLYTFVGIPLAHIAETRNRVWIMSICVALWSLMTALCGMATEITVGSITIGAFWILLVCRVGVGIGEAGCTPPANSLIADYYPPRMRSTALGYYAMGVTLGTMFANIVGGLVLANAEAMIDFFNVRETVPFLATGWRMAFLVVGLPGLLIALIFKLTVKEPPRGYTDPPEVRAKRAAADAAAVGGKEKVSFIDGMRELASKPAFWLMSAGATIAAFCGYGISSFQSLFLVRTHEIDASFAALYINTPVSLSSAVGTFVTGWLATRLYKKYPGAIAWLPAGGLALSVPLYLWAFSTGNLWFALTGLVIGGFVKYGYLASQYTIGQGVVTARVRATATAILLFVVNFIGYGFGPLFIGLISDVFFNSGAAANGMAGELTRQMCRAPATLSEAQLAVCGDIFAPSLQKAMLITAALYLISALFFLLTWRRLDKDMVAK